MDISKREAHGIRGRFGCDIWEIFVNLPGERKREILTKQGVPAERLTQTLAELMSILYDEDIRQA